MPEGWGVQAEDISEGKGLVLCQVVGGGGLGKGCRA